jgi:site-specific recombinase XerD
LAEFLYATGLRIAEAASLLPENIDTRARRVYLPKGKGGKSRTAFLTGYAAEVMEIWLKQGRAALPGRGRRKNGKQLFGTGRETLAKAANAELKKVCGELDIPVITCHGFRHSLGTHLLKSGCDMRHIQMILGHESLNSTQIYTRVDKEDLKNSLDQYHPGCMGEQQFGASRIATSPRQFKKVPA